MTSEESRNRLESTEGRAACRGVSKGHSHADLEKEGGFGVRSAIDCQNNVAYMCLEQNAIILYMYIYMYIWKWSFTGLLSYSIVYCSVDLGSLLALNTYLFRDLSPIRMSKALFTLSLWFNKILWNYSKWFRGFLITTVNLNPALVADILSI